MSWSAFTRKRIADDEGRHAKVTGMDCQPDHENPDEHLGGTLVLFFTFGVALTDWEADGILDREVALYNELATAFDEVYLLTYGGGADLDYSDRLDHNVSVVPKKRIHNDVLYSLLCPVIHRGILADADVIKTNQMLGSWTALLASLLYRIPLVVRTGYVLSTFYRELDKPFPVRLVANLVEFVAYKGASGVITSSPHGFEYIEERYDPGEPHEIIPNYIETDVFRPMDVDSVGELCFVGRLAEQKNLFVLLEALVDLPYSVTLVGEGPLDDELEAHATKIGVDATFAGRVSNHELPALLNAHEVFVLPSHFEGMPKSLLEAMACGLACIGTDVPGTRDVIRDGELGILCDPDVVSIRSAIERVLEDESLRARLGERAREEIVSHYSLSSVVATELDLYSRLTE